MGQIHAKSTRQHNQVDEEGAEDEKCEERGDIRITAAFIFERSTLESELITFNLARRLLS